MSVKSQALEDRLGREEERMKWVEGVVRWVGDGDLFEVWCETAYLLMYRSSCVVRRAER